MRGQFLLAYRYLTGRRQRMLLTTLAIVFGVAVLFGMNAMLPGVMNAFRHTMISAAGKVGLTISSSSNNTFSTDTLEKIKGITGVRAFTGVLMDSIQIPASLGGKTDPLTGSAAITLNGVDLASASTVRKFSVEEGRFLAAGDDQAAVISYNLARKMGLVVGDRLVIPSAQGKAALEVVGILNQLESSTTDEVYVPLPTAQQILHAPGQISGIDILLDAQAESSAVEQAILTALGPAYKIGAVEVGNELSAALEMGQNIMWVFGILALAMAAFIIFNTFRTVVAERRRDLGMLRAVGASKRTVLSLIVTESLIQGVIGTLLGLVLGYLIAYSILMGLSPMIQSFMRIELGAPVIEPANLIASILLGVGFTVASGYIPARAATRVTPLEALRPAPPAVERRAYRKRTLIGLLILAASLAGLVLGELALASLATLAFMIGLIMVIPAAVRPFANLFGALFTRLYKRQGNIAQGNLARQPGRAAITASAMMIGLAITIAMIGMVTSVFSGFFGYLDKSLGSDYLLMPSSLILGGGNLGAAPQFASGIGGVEGVAGVTSLRLAASQAKNASLQMIGIDPQQYPLISGLEFSQGDPAAAYNALQTGRAVIVNGIFAASSAVKVGDTLTLDTPEGPQEYRVAGVGMDYLNAKLATGYISQRDMERDFNVTSDVLIMANREAGADEARVTAEIKALVADYPSFTLIDAAAFKAEQMKVFSSAQTMIYALVFMVAIPGLIAMANTLGINIIERTREIGMLRAVGSTRKQVRQMVFVESLLLSALGTTMGIIVGLFMSYYLVKALNFSGFKLEFYFPGLGVLTAIAVGLLFGVVAAMIPARQAAKTPIVEALRYE